MLNIHQKYCKETFYNGLVEKFEAVFPENFNFAYDVLDEIAKQDPNRRAMLWCNEEGEEHSFTFEDMMRYSNQAANLFASYGVKKGDCVALILKRHYQFWSALLGLHKLGAVGIPGPVLLTKKDFVYRFNYADIKAVICTADGDVADSVDAAIPEAPEVTNKFIVNGQREGWVSFDDEIKSQPTTLERVEIDVRDPMLIYFTSGTSGMQKMVYHDYSYPIAHIPTAKYWHNVVPDGLHLTISDSGWMKSMWGKLYGQWFMEAGIFVYDYEKFIPSVMLSLFEKYKITTFCAPPTMFRFFIQEDLKKYDLSSLKHTCIAGEALNPEVFNQFRDATGLKLMEGFGQTETTLTVFNQVGTDPKPGSMGKPSPAYDTYIADEDGNPAPAGAVGEIVIRTDKAVPCGLFTCYHKDEERTKEAWHDGVYHTGDNAWMDEDGYIWYVGRTDDVIKSSGYRIGPFEIESVLMEHPSVLECAVTGAPDPLRGTVVKATVVLTKSYSPSEELKKELQDYVKKQTAPYKYPRIVEFVEQLPKTFNGKIRRVQLREESQAQQQ
ncbi:MAG: AMP-binding protein [Oscillospiraceae bacterium]|jgi:acetyl-CoA synthetase|nr:AMP-binding protein [Oscillospiraceae bacterium]